MKKYIVFLLITPQILTSSCSKDKNDDNDNNIETYRLPTEALEYIQLPVDTYYIYKDSATGVTDSVVVKESSITTIYVPEHQSTGPFDPSYPASYHQTFALVLKSIKPTSEENWFKGFTRSYVPSLVEVANAAEYCCAFSYPIGYSNGPVNAEYIIPSYSVEGKNYDSVLVYMSANDTDPTQPYYRKTTYYWVKRLGIVKREIKTSNSIKIESLVRNG